LVILTLGMLVVALFQVTGRIAVALLDDLELAVNQVLSERGVRVSGLRGDWRMLNPVVHIEQLTLPAGRIDGVVVELDMVETVLRGTLLARRLAIADLDLEVVKPAGESWRLAGAGEPVDFDPLPLLRHSDQLEVAGTLRFVRAEFDTAAIHLDYLGVNRGGEHRHALTLRNDAASCADGCSLDVDYHGREALWPLRPQQAALNVTSSGFRLPRTVLGISPLELSELDARWRVRGDSSGGTLRLHAAQFDMPGDVTLATRLSGAVGGQLGRYRGAIDTWEVTREDAVWVLPEVSIRGDVDGVSVWLPSLDLGRAGVFLRRALAAVAPAERWLGGLNIRGSAHNVRGRYGFDGSGLAYALTLDEVALDGFKGVPMLRGAAGELIGYGRGLQFNLNAEELDLAFPDVFTGEWRLPYAQGALQAWFSPDYFGIRGLNLRGEALGSRAAGSFAMSRPPDREGQRLLLLVSTDRMGMAEAQQFIPYRLPDGLRRWLEEAPRAGTLDSARVAYQGQFQEEPGELARRLALTSGIREGRIRYQAEWPEVSGLDGELLVSGSLVEVDVARATSAGARMGNSRVRVLDNAAVVNLSLDAETDGTALLDFVRTTPLRNWLGFVEADWESAGPLRVSGDLSVPLGDDDRDLAVRLRADLEGVDLAMPGFRLALEELEGAFRYRYPYFVDAAGLAGRLFGEPVTIGALTDSDATDADPDRVHLVFRGRATPEDVWRTVDMADPGVAAGAFDFAADMGIAVTEGVASVLTVNSDLRGVALDLPAGLGKAAEATVPGEVRVTFEPELTVLDFDYREATGWLHVDERARRGAIGFNGAPVAPDPASSHLVLSGRLDAFALEEVVPGDEAGMPLPLPVRLDGLQVDRIDVGDFAVSDAILGGDIGPDAFEVRIRSTEVIGVVSQTADELMELSFAEVNVPADTAATETGDPLTPDIIAELPAAQVWVDRLRLGEDDYGAWRFALQPGDGELRVANLRAEVRGVTVRASEPLVWRGDAGETRFVGTIDGGNLAEVLPQWGYAPSVETDSAVLEGDFAWDGSPLAVDLLKLRGAGSAVAEEGRFLDVESGAAGGAQRIFSLLNFTAIAKRMALNFGDVFGRGISFDQLSAEIALDEGLLAFTEPMDVEGTGSSFRVTGSVNLDTGALDNEMIVTLPVSQSLPWYAAYVALANPLAGVGLLVGERVFRKPLEQFSSARYRIGGTLEEPDVKLVSVFDVTTPAREAGQAAEAATGEVPIEATQGGEPDVPAEQSGAPAATAPTSEPAGDDEVAAVESDDSEESQGNE
jgi:uncharacterized protein (TIGR02099 family)